MTNKTLFVFDIETIPDLLAARNLLDIKDKDLDSELIKERLIQYHLDISGGRSSFLRQPFHQVVAISFLEAEIQYRNNSEYYVLKQIRSGGDINSDEKELVHGFFSYLSNLYPRIVTFNGKAFDMPVLKYRAMLYGVQAKWLYKTGDKWNNYNAKYSLDWHCDLLEALSDFGTSTRIRMHEVCAMFGLPGKMEVDGSMVEQLYYAGEIDAIRDYCELDVLNTYLLFLRYTYHTGTISKGSYDSANLDLVNFLKQNAESKRHFMQFLDKWLSNARELYFNK